MKKYSWMTGLVCALWITGCAYKHRLLVNPEVPVPASASNAEVQKAVRAALTSKGWIVDQEEHGSTTAHLKQDKLFASVRVEYDQKQAVIRHLASQNFLYKKTPSGEEHIHSHYLLWVRNVANRLREKLNPISH